MVIREQSISLNGLRFYAYHGVEPQESVVGAWYSVSIQMETDITVAIDSDTISDTINYAKVASIVKQQMQIRSKLLEHVAGRIANALLDTYNSLQLITVGVSKENPPIGIPCSSATVKITAVR
jgi:dihydroneopterin aldolase